MIEVVIEDEAWREALPDAQALAERCQAAALMVEPALSREIALLLCDDGAIRALNGQFRDKDVSTNVLSFPAGDDVANDGVANDSVASDGVAGENAGFLGDIALARETCVREAADKNIALSDHAAHLIIHAMLHLVGYDHQADDEAALMERRETEILASMGVSDPYAPLDAER